MTRDTTATSVPLLVMTRARTVALSPSTCSSMYSRCSLLPVHAGRPLRGFRRVEGLGREDAYRLATLRQGEPGILQDLLHAVGIRAHLVCRSARPRVHPETQHDNHYQEHCSEPVHAISFRHGVTDRKSTRLNSSHEWI